MRIYCAPMEGITGRFFRQAHNKWFGGVDKYYIPFLSPTQTHVFGNKEWQEVLPENNHGLYAVPQLLTKNADDFLWAAKELAAIGYQEVNLNLGCPSGTVVSKGKGSGFLSHIDELSIFLDQIYTSCPIAISIKTRLGVNDPAEFSMLLELFQRYPVHELIVHARVQKDFYKLPARRDFFASYLPKYTLSVCYNGDLSTSDQCHTFCAQFPNVASVMLGRGLIGDPALARKSLGGAPADIKSLQGFHDELFESYCVAFQNSRNAMMRMKELWFYLIGLFDNSEKAGKSLRKATERSTFEAHVNSIFANCPLRQDNTFSCL